MAKSKLYNIWANMKSRCNSVNRKDSKYYSLKGISVCESWLSFKGFESWAIEIGYIDGLSLERIDNEKGYYPGNCKFIILENQPKNRSSNILLTHNGQTKILSEWARELNINQRTIKSRIDAGFSVKEALTMKKNRLFKSSLFEFKNEFYTKSQLAKVLGINKIQVHRLLEKGLTPNEIYESLRANKLK